MSDPFLSVVIPAYNESKRLPQTLADIDGRLKKLGISHEIIVVDDGSKDGTPAIIEKMKGSVGNLRSIANPENHGKGFVVKQGMLAAKGEWRLFTDADNSTTIDQFQKMLPYIKENYEVMIGSRDVPGAVLSPPQPWYKVLLGNFGNFLIQLILLEFLWGIWDTQCGFKCFSGEAASKVFKLSCIERWGFDVEILALAKKMGYKIKEIPVVWVNDPNSKVRASAYLTTFLEVFKIRWWLWRDKYNLG